MPALLVTFFAWLLAGTISRILVGAGLTLVVYSWISGAVDGLIFFMIVTLDSTLPGSAASILWIAGVGDALSIIGSCVAAVGVILSARMFIGTSS